MVIHSEISQCLVSFSTFFSSIYFLLKYIFFLLIIHGLDGFGDRGIYKDFKSFALWTHGIISIMES